MLLESNQNLVHHDDKFEFYSVMGNCWGVVLKYAMLWSDL